MGAGDDEGLSLRDRQQNDFEIEKLNAEQRFELEKLKLEHAFEREKSDRQDRFEAAHEYARQVTLYSVQHGKDLVSYGQLCLRTLSFMNGGAIVALLALIGSIVGKSPALSLTPAALVPAFGKFVVGMVLTLVAMLCFVLI